MIKLLFSGIKKFRPTWISVILLVFASARMFLSGNAITIAGVCAGVVPFICQVKRYPNRDEAAPEIQKVLANYFMNLLFMVIYLCFMTGVTVLGRTLLPSYTVNPYYKEMLALAVCADLIFISCIYTVGHRLTPGQRMMEGILLCNGQLGFMFLAAGYVSRTDRSDLVLLSAGFAVLIFLLTLGFIKINYGSKRAEPIS